MAECSYARCLQERRLIKRELMKWSKDMLNIVGLERIAEELMGRRKWKHYQDTLARTHLNTANLSVTSEFHSKLDNNTICVQKEPPSPAPPPQQQQKVAHQKEESKVQEIYEENHRQGEKDKYPTKKHHRTAETETESNQASEIKRLASEFNQNNSKILKAEKEDNNNSSTSHNHLKKNTLSNNSDVNITNQQDSLPIQINFSDLLTNLRLQKVLKSEFKTSATISSPPPLYLQPQLDQEIEEEIPEPNDWKPNEKCYFCIDGKLLTVNEKGELVAESDPALSEADQAHRQIIDADSESNDSYTHDSPLTSQIGSTTTNAISSGASKNRRSVNVNKLLASHLRDLPANMTSMDSMAARLAAIRSISGQLYPNLDFNWLLAQQQQQQPQTNSATRTTSNTSANAISPVLKDSPDPSEAPGEQPLDLSSKPSPNSSISGDVKLPTRSKLSRTTPVPTGRRTYSDDDLTNALQDIINGKLGTRKAAVQYNIPRSTLRNKVYKMTMDDKRSNIPAPSELLKHLHKELEFERDVNSADEEESNDSTSHTDALPPTSPPPPPPLIDDHPNRIDSSATLRKHCDNNNLDDSQRNACASPRPTSTAPNALNLDSFKRQANHNTQAPSQTSPSPQMPPILIDPNVLLQTLLLSAGALQNSANLQPKLDETVTLRDLFNAILLNSGINLKDVLPSTTSTPSTSGDSLNNGSGKLPNMIDRLLLQQQTSPVNAQSHTHLAHRLPKSETPDTNSSLDANEASDDPSVILRIPSYKPVAGSSSTSAQVNAIPTSSAQSPSTVQQSSTNVNINRNGDSPHSQRSAQSPLIATSMLAAAMAAASGSGKIASSHQQPNNISVISPPLMRQSLNADSQSPPSFSLRDVIANSIHRTMNEQANKDAHAAASMLGLGSNSDSERNVGNDYKAPSISVVKNIGGTDTSRFGKAPNLLSSGMVGHNSHHHQHHHQHHMQHAHHSAHHLSRQEAAALAAGKGTRPKRGKYRNYDRDSLVEAVKAVQRGEMSVHRAGSYYGVPHSTLEYKVKERHLMRPRKREPKPQPLDGPATISSGSKSNSNIPGQTTANNLDKLKNNSTNVSSNSKLGSALKNSSGNYASTSPNGMKLSMFDANVAAQMQYAPHLFWPHSTASFGAMQMDFNRNAAQNSNTTANINSACPPTAGNASPYVNADILKSHIQRYQEESMRNASATSSNSHKSAHTPSPIASPMPVQNVHHVISYKSTRELAENIYETVGNANGSTPSSFLDGIIRKSLDRKSNEVTPPPNSGALLDQLLVKKIPLPFPNNHSNDFTTTSGAPIKRSGSPLTPVYANVDIKRERNSPLNSDEASNGEVDEQNNNRSNDCLTGLNDEHSCIAPILSQQRNRIISHDSDTDAHSLKSGIQIEMYTNPRYNHNTSSNVTDVNGGASSKMQVANVGNISTSILQEKLGQIKAESEENL